MDKKVNWKKVKSIMKEYINSTTSLKFHIITTILGILISIFSFLSFLKLFDDNNKNINYYINLSTLTYFIVLGIVLIIVNFNLNNPKVKVISVLSAGIIIGMAVYNEPLRMGLILLLVGISLFLIMKRFVNIFSTIITFSLSSIVFLIIASILIMYINDKYINVLMYIIITVFLIAYRFAGVKMNHFFIKNLIGTNDDAKRYDHKQLENQISLLYLIIFIIFNISNYFIDNAIIANVINNSFVTILAIYQIKWDLILNYQRSVIIKQD